MRDSVDSVTCPVCGDAVDVWRAPKIRFSGKKKWYFCSRAHGELFEFPVEHALAPQGSLYTLAEPVVQSEPHSVRSSLLVEGLEPSQIEEKIEPEPFIGQSKPWEDNDSGPSAQETGEPHFESGMGMVVESAKVALGSDRRKAINVVFNQSRKGANRPSWLTVEALAPFLVWVSAGLALSAGEEYWSLIASALIVTLALVGGYTTVRIMERPALERTKRLQGHLRSPTLRVTPQGVHSVSPEVLRPGEEIVVQAGQWLTADGVVSEGTGEVLMWEGATQTVTAGPGTRLVAGAFFKSGKCVLVCSKTGSDRALAPLALLDGVGIDSRVVAARWSRRMALHLAPLIGVLAGVLTWLSGGSYSLILGSTGVAWGSLSHPLARHLPRLICRKWLLWSAGHGISFAHERTVDQAGTVTVAVFCARGTVLHGEPDVAEIHPLRGANHDDILSWAAGAESVIHHPVAAAVLRSAEARKIRANVCSSHQAAPGMGVTCVSSDGDMLVVGSRELLLQERISVAMAEEMLRGLESRGLTALMVAKDNHLVGVLGLQDSVRIGAKASIQLLLDEGIEPILLSGDSRATTEAVAHALAIDHIRPEVPAPSRAHEIHSLLESGAHVAVIGTSPRDDPALMAAPVPIILEGASIRLGDSSLPSERGVGLSGGYVLAAPLALMTCRRIRRAGMLSCSLAFLPPIFGVLGTASQLMPLYLAPLLSSAGAALAAWSCMRFSQKNRVWGPKFES